MREQSDVIVCGGGLAGLTLAYQLRKENPEASVTVVERTTRPLPEACHKVGESSVELLPGSRPVRAKAARPPGAPIGRLAPRLAHPLAALRPILQGVAPQIGLAISLLA